MKPKFLFSVFLKIAGVAVAFWLIWSIIQKTDGKFLPLLAEGRLVFFFLAAGVFFLVQFLGTCRWEKLLKGQGILLSRYELFRSILCCNALNLVIPGAISGDVVRMAALMKDVPTERRAAVALTVIVDRLVGLYALFLVAILSLGYLALLNPALFNQYPLMKFLTILIGSLVVLMPLGLLSTKIAEWLGRHSWIRSLLGRLPVSVRQRGMEFLEASKIFLQQKRACLTAFAFSLAIHFLLGILVWLLGIGMHETKMSLVQYIASAQLGNATALFPITPGGIGLRDMVNAACLKMFQATPPEVMGVVPVVNTIIMIVVSFAGFLLPKRNSLKTSSGLSSQSTK